MPQSGEVKTKRVPFSPTQGVAVTHPVPDVVRFTRVRHMLTVRYLCLVDIVTVRHCPQRQRRHKVETESDRKKKKKKAEEFLLFIKGELKRTHISNTVDGKMEQEQQKAKQKQRLKNSFHSLKEN